MTTATHPRAARMALRHSGDFSLVRSVRSAGRAVFLDPVAGADGLELAFALDETWAPVALRVHQPSEPGSVHASVLANPDGADPAAIRANLRRILALAPDGRGLDDVAARDPVAAGMIARCRGLRPIAYPTPYEAAAHTIIGHRLGIARAAAIFTEIARSHGTALDVGDHRRHLFPAPDVLAALRGVNGLSERKVDQLRSLGREAAAGGLGADGLRAMERADAMRRLQELPGIGPFSAELVMIRGAGDPDVFARTEGRLHHAMAAAYELQCAPDVDVLEGLAEAWRPYRSWVSLLFRDATKDRSTGSIGARCPSSPRTGRRRPGTPSRVAIACPRAAITATRSSSQRG